LNRTAVELIVGEGECSDHDIVLGRDSVVTLLEQLLRCLLLKVVLVDDHTEDGEGEKDVGLEAGAFGVGEPLVAVGSNSTRALWDEEGQQGRREGEEGKELTLPPLAQVVISFCSASVCSSRSSPNRAFLARASLDLPPW